MRERARRLAGPHRRVDPALIEKPLGDRRHLRREGAVCGQHRVSCLAPAHIARRDLRQRGIAIPVRQLFLAEPFGLQRIIAVRQQRISGAHRGDERVDHLGLDLVIEVPRVGNIGEAAPAVGNFLVLGKRVGDQRELLEVLSKHLGQGLCGGFPFYAGTVLQQIERGLDRQ